MKISVHLEFQKSNGGIVHLFLDGKKEGMLGSGFTQVLETTEGEHTLTIKAGFRKAVLHFTSTADVKVTAQLGTFFGGVDAECQGEDLKLLP